MEIKGYQCSYCTSIKETKEGKYDGKKHPLYDPLDGWSHGVCPECYERVVKEIDSI